MPFPNKYAAQCEACAAVLLPQEGLTIGPPWKSFCKDHVPVGGEIVRITMNEECFMVKPERFLGGARFVDYQNAIAGSLYVKEEKAQIVDDLDRLVRIVDRLKEEKFDVRAGSPEIAASIQAQRAKIAGGARDADARMDVIEERLKARGLALFPFQRRGAIWLSKRNAGLLADHPGLGKTATTLCSLQDDPAVLVVGPALARPVWGGEAGKFRPELDVSTFLGRKSFRWPERGELCVISYDVLPDLAESEEAPPDATVVFDEAHYLKNRDAKRTIRSKEIASRVLANRGRAYALTATPLLNLPYDLWTLLDVIGCAREAFKSWKNFIFVFNGEAGEMGGYDFPPDPRPEAADCLRRVSLRRVRQDVLPELPPKMWRDIVVELPKSEMRELEDLLADLGPSRDDVQRWLRGDEIPDDDTQAALSTVRVHLAKAKIPALVGLVEDLEAQAEPIVVFSAHLAPIDFMGKRPGWGAITSETSDEDRAKFVDLFQAGKLKGIAATIQAGGVSITLTRAAQMIFVDRDYTPALNEQAEDRCVRIGQTRGVLITRIVADHPVDKHVAEVLAVKQKRIDGSIEKAVDHGVADVETGSSQASAPDRAPNEPPLPRIPRTGQMKLDFAEVSDPSKSRGDAS